MKLWDIMFETLDLVDADNRLGDDDRTSPKNSHVASERGEEITGQ